MNEPYLLTIDDLVERTQLPKSWWYDKTRQRKANGLPVIKCNKYLRFDWQEVEVWLRRRSEDG